MSSVCQPGVSRPRDLTRHTRTARERARDGRGPAAHLERAGPGREDDGSGGQEEGCQRPRRESIPMVSPGRRDTSRTASRTPGMNEARS